MANTIKGLTVEIAGDTTKLGKALEDVNKKSRDLSSELGQINKLLKMDPGNADLLAQKQKVLANAVSTTSEKLKKLKEAEKQVQEQFKRGEVSEEQVRELQREIIATEKKMQSYEKAAKETADEIKNLGKKSDDAADDTKDLEKGSDKASDALDDMAKSADKAGDASDGLGSKLGGLVKGGLAALAAGVTAAIGAMVASAEATREYRREMGKLEAAFTTNGHSAEAATKTYQTLQGILGETDQAVEAANHLAKLTDNEKELAQWTNVATGVYATFGASLPIENLTEAANETAKTGALTGGLADALNWAGVNEEDFQAKLDACSNEQERQSLILETLNGLYSEAADKYREVNAEVIRANEANEAWTASMAEVGGAIEPVLTDIKLLGASLLSDLVPGVQQVAEAFRGMLNGDEGSAAALGETLSGMFEDALDKVVEILPQAAEVATSLITTLTTSLLGMLPDLTRTVMQMATQVITSLGQAMPTILSSIIDSVFGVINNLLGYVPDVLAAITEFIGILTAEVPNIAAQITGWIPVIVDALVTGLLENIPVLLEGALLLLNAIVDAIPVLLELLIPQIPFIVNTIIDGLIALTPELLGAAIDLLFAIIEAIPTIVSALIKAVPDILKAILDILRKLPELIWTILKEVVTKFVNFVTESKKKSEEGMSKVFSAIVDALKNLPSVLWEHLKATIDKVVKFGTDAVSKAKTAAKNIFDAVVNGIKELPSKMLSIGSDIVRGLWNGISNMTDWITGKLSSFGDSVLGGIKDFFGIASPSKVFRDEVGKMLPAGMAQGIEENAYQPLKAMTDLASDLLDEADSPNGITLERQMRHTFAAPEQLTSAQTGMLDKLDKILTAIEHGQIITLDGKALVGATAAMTDSALGQRRVLAARGAV